MTHIRHHIVVLLALITTFLAAPAFAETQEAWAIRALELQEHLDINQPFNRTFWVGTHNSYNAYDWDFAYTIDANQHYTPTEQLEMGVRELTFDIYNTAPIGTTLRMCHGSCSGVEKKFNAGLKAIRDWIDDGNQDSVVFLKLEIGDNKWAKIGSQVDSYLGDYVYKPREGEISYNHSSSDCYGLEPEHLTKADVLAEGKNVVVIVTRDNGCPDSSTFQEWIHVGFEYDDGTFDEKFEKDTDYTGCEALYNAGRMTRLHDGITFNDAMGLADEDQKIQESNFAGYMACGLNVFELFNFGDQRYDGVQQLTGHNALEVWDMVWSWGEDQPTNDGDCAVFESTDDRFRVGNCASETNPHACYSDSLDEWQITSAQGNWYDGEAACEDEFSTSDHRYSVPHNAKQMSDLAEIITTDTWVNYTDLSVDDTWVADPEDIDPIFTRDELGGTGGSAFDDLDASLLTGDSRRITNIAMRYGARIDALEITYSDGTIAHHGGTGGGWSADLVLDSQEHIERVEICIDKKNGSHRVFYLAFETNKGDTLSAGSYEGSCTSWQSSLYGILAFYGRSGEELDALGFYYSFIPSITVIDNDDTDIATIANGVLGGAWPTATTTSGYYGSNYAYAYGDNGADAFIWAFVPDESGHYDISARWTAHSNRTIAEYELSTNFLDSAQTFETTEKDQTQDGGQDNLLWSDVYLQAGTIYYLRMNSTEGGYVAADSVTFETTN